MNIYSGEEYAILSAALSPEELTCIGHCAVYTCVMNGECSTEDKVADILAKHSQQRRNAMFIALPKDNV